MVSMVPAEPITKDSQFEVRTKNVVIRGVILRPRDDFEFAGRSGTEIYSSLPSEKHEKGDVTLSVTSHHNVTLPANYRITDIFVQDAPSSQNAQ